MSIVRWFFVAWASLAVAGAAAAQAIDDPLRPGQEAELIRRAQAGGTIRLAAGTFRLTSTLSLTRNVEIIGASQNATIIQGNGEGAVIQYSGTGFFTLRDVTVEYSGTGWANVIDAESGSIDFRNITVSGSRVVAESYGMGIRLRGTVRGTIRDALVHRNEGDGIAVHGNADVSLRNNTVSFNERRGISFSASAAGVVRDNIVEGNWLDGIGVFGEAAPTLENNTVILAASQSMSPPLAPDSERVITLADYRANVHVLHGILGREGGSVRLGEGIFEFPGTISMRRDTTVIGAGKSRTILRLRPGASVVGLGVFEVANGNEVEFSDLTIEGSATSSVVYVLDSTINLQDVTLRGARVGLRLGSSSSAFLWGRTTFESVTSGVQCDDRANLFLFSDDPTRPLEGSREHRLFFRGCEP
jgi:parallel beta-helix repeat protein